MRTIIVWSLQWWCRASFIVPVKLIIRQKSSERDLIDNGEFWMRKTARRSKSICVQRIHDGFSQVDVYLPTAKTQSCETNDDVIWIER